MPVQFKSDKKRWEFSFNRVIAGRRLRATKLLPKGWTRTQAEAYDQKETARLFALAAGAQGQRRLIDDAIEVYCKERLPTLKGADKQIKEINNCAWAFAGRYIDELPEVAREYIEHATKADGETPLAPATVRNRMAYVRAACRYAFKYHKFCEHDPAERLVLPSPRNERHYYSSRKEALQIVRKVKNRSARVALLAAFYSGMRLGEIRKCAVYNGEAFLLDDTKNGTRRMVPIHYKLKSYLKRFPIKAAERTIQGCHKRACVELGLGHLHVHDMRHSAASEMINDGVDLYSVGIVLGHKSAQSTKRYSHLDFKTLAAAVASIGRKK
jgi:integrase